MYTFKYKYKCKSIYSTYIYIYIEIYTEIHRYRDVDTDPKDFGISLLGGIARMPQDLRYKNYKPEVG